MQSRVSARCAGTEPAEERGLPGAMGVLRHAVVSAKELTVLPNRTSDDQGRRRYGLILTQGHGTIGRHHVSTPAMIRFGEMTEARLSVTADAAADGVRIQNLSDTEPLVILKHL